MCATGTTELRAKTLPEAGLGSLLHDEDIWEVFQRAAEEAAGGSRDTLTEGQRGEEWTCVHNTEVGSSKLSIQFTLHEPWWTQGSI